ncbi:uncharacterized protein LOC104870017 [Fukomys damarensis]|uniref:uncharacterized protein LOC104870017 n=1 Tax=Fukomys damarensis TaxID=885580 RepID=UPI00053FD22F|nr:uncharacterized protein LOC104870017 [Fukomys damarensis]
MSYSFFCKEPDGFRQVSARFPPGFRQVSARFPPGPTASLSGLDSVVKRSPRIRGASPEHVLPRAEPGLAFSTKSLFTYHCTRVGLNLASLWDPSPQVPKACRPQVNFTFKTESLEFRASCRNQTQQPASISEKIKSALKKGVGRRLIPLCRPLLWMYSSCGSFTAGAGLKIKKPSNPALPAPPPPVHLHSNSDCPPKMKTARCVIKLRWDRYERLQSEPSPITRQILSLKSP